jgi:uncharacterized protein with GYD domain
VLERARGARLKRAAPEAPCLLRGFDPASRLLKKETAMNTYIQLLSWTEQGVRSVKDSPARLEAAKKTIRELGGEMKSFHLTMGAYDMVVVLEAPSDEVAARFALSVAQGGNVRTQTLKAFPEAQYRDIIGSLK